MFRDGLVKIDSDGNQEWFVDEMNGIFINQTNDGGYIIVGRTSFGYGNEDVYVIKTYSNGTEQWSQTYGGINYDLGVYIQQTDDGGFIIVGQTDSYGNGDFDIYLIKSVNVK